LDRAQARPFNGHVTTLDGLAGKLFASTPEVADILGRDERTIRKAAESGLIPGKKIGARWAIPTAWLRQQAGLAEPPPATAAPDPDELADQVAARVLARLARVLAQGAAAASDGPEAT
jgi:Helix-turn-helix domain